MPTPRELLAQHATQAQMSSFFIDRMGIISVKSYGASGDGVTDDTAEVQAAVTAAVANGNHELYFPHGIYYVTALTDTSTLTFIGDNSSFTGGYAGTITDLSSYMKVSITLDSQFIAGESDYSAAIDRAFATFTTLGGGELILTPGKTYSVSKEHIVPDNVTIKGEGSIISVPIGNFTGAITRFYAVFTTVALTSAPQSIWWRVGTGTISHENIKIEGITFNLNRDGAVLTAGQMTAAGFNAVRFEDAKNCTVKNCKFIDLQTATVYNADPVIQFVRSENCILEKSYFEKIRPIHIAESTYCQVKKNKIVSSIQTAIETLSGSHHEVLYNTIDPNGFAFTDSMIGINSPYTTVEDNKIVNCYKIGILFGHTGTTAYTYNLDKNAHYSTCKNNKILAGEKIVGDTASFYGIVTQYANYTDILENKLFNLPSAAVMDITTYNYAAIYVGSDFNTVNDNKIDSCGYGITLRYTTSGMTAWCRDNIITNCYAGIIHQLSNLANLIIKGNFIKTCTLGLYIRYAYLYAENNMFDAISSASYGAIQASFSYVHLIRNKGNECTTALLTGTECYKYELDGNIYTKAVANTFAISIYNSSNPMTFDKIISIGNHTPGATSQIQVTGVTDVPNSTNITDTVPRVMRFSTDASVKKASVNVGALPTLTTGLSTGDLWNDAGTVKVV